MAPEILNVIQFAMEFWIEHGAMRLGFKRFLDLTFLRHKVWL
jgi:hypothetical protein